MMQEQFNEAFDAIEASDELVEMTTHVVLASMRNLQDVKRRNRWGLMTAVAMACLLFVGSSAMLYFTPTAVVSVDINPSLEMEINRFDRVVDVNGYNEDGIALAKALNVTHMRYSEAMDALIASDIVNELMAQDGDLTIAVVPTKSVEQGDEIVAYVNQCTTQHQNTHCYMMSNDAHHQAHELGLSCGRYQAYVALSKVEDNITPAQLNAMSMKEIRERMEEYGINDASFGNNGCGQGNGSCQGSGHYHRHGRVANTEE